MSEAVETVPAWPGFAGERGVLDAIWDDLVSRKVRPGKPGFGAHVLAIMDLSELMGRPFVLMRGGWKRVRA